ncbi:hypothetical protein BVY03_06135 [bacterium K02(2017)]|nr:hypothetical protein BVY03_06135 [bacterium K02(2017)]
MDVKKVEKNRQPPGLSNKVEELEQLVETISRSKTMWETTFDVISDPVLIINRNFEIKRANKAFAKACNIDIRKVSQKKCYKIFAGYDSTCPDCPVFDTLESNEPHYVELNMFPKQRQYNVNAYSMPKLNIDPDESIILHYRDITDQKQLQKRLMHSEKMAAVGTLAGGVAHEINNPLGGILAFVQLVMRELGDDNSCTEDLKEIEDAALRCKKIVRNLLNFSRQDFEEDMVFVDINDVINKSMSLIKINAKHNNVNINLDISDQIPHLTGDLNKLQQVILNLVTNSMHSMNENGGELSISSFSNPENSKVFLQIKDTGHGIDQEKIDRIFDPYFTTKGQGEGTGLGLAITYKIIEEHNGKIDVESEVGIGTTVTIQFPAIKK